MRNKHAYLVMAHNNFEVLEVLLKLLDDERNDIYLHIDAKSNCIDCDKLKLIINKSNLIIVDSIDVRWGDISQVICEYNLLEKAVKKGEYMYYHLLSGADMPIKKQGYIHSFFDEHQGKEFIHFDNEKLSAYYKDRVNYYYVFQPILKKFKNNILNENISKLNKLLVSIQKILKVRRYKGDYTLQKGANWFSITHEFACYALNKKDWILSTFKMTANPDEMFLQTLVVNSDFNDSLFSLQFNDTYDSCQRLIDWKRGNPYIWKIEDFDEIINSNLLFARKFDCNVDNEVIEEIYKLLKS